MTKLNKISLIITLILVVLLGALCGPSFSIVHADGNYTSYNNYIYDSYRVDVVVKEDNSFDITETVTMTYGDEIYGRHQGWARGIPYNLSYTTYDAKGTKYKYQAHAKVTLDSATEYYDSYKENGNYVIEMKRPGVYVNGETKTYVIKYNYYIGYDFIDFKDFFNFNIIGNDFPVKVNGVEFSITMPKEFDASSLKFYYGTYGQTQQLDSSKYSVTGNVIASTSPINLLSYEALTINLDLPQGYFNTPSGKTYNLIQTLIPIIAGAMLVVLVVILLFTQNRNTPTQVVEFYAPDDLTPGECKYILEGKVSALDVSSIIVVWASRGLVKIVLDENKKPIKIARIKDIPDNFSRDEKSIWNKLFATNDIVDVDFSMSVSEEMNYVAKNIKLRYNSVSSEVTSKDGTKTSYTSETSSRFTGKSIRKGIMLSLLAIILPVVYIICMAKYHGMGSMVTIIFSTVLLLALSNILAVTMFNNYVDSGKLNKKKLIIMMLLAFAFVIPALIMYVTYTANIIDKAYTMIWYFVLCEIVLALHLGKQYVLNQKVYDYYGRVAGFKNAIEHAEADMLKKLVKDDPEYFYKVIPYAHVFGVYEKFVDNFRGFAMPINDNIGDTMTTILILDNMRYRARYNMARSMASKASSSFGSHGGGGGGFSGGGFGGGGGRGL